MSGFASPRAATCARSPAFPARPCRPASSIDGRFIVFTHIDPKSHSLGVWDRKKGSVQRVRFPATWLSARPSRLTPTRWPWPLSNGKYPVIYLLNHASRRNASEGGHSINVSRPLTRPAPRWPYLANPGGPQISSRT